MNDTTATTWLKIKVISIHFKDAETEHHRTEERHGMTTGLISSVSKNMSNHLTSCPLMMDFLVGLDHKA